MAEAKAKAEVVEVEMEDGRKVGFAGKRKVLKEVLVDEGKVVTDGDTITLQAGAVSLRMDFRNGMTRTFPLNVGLLAQYAGHGAAQKFGDELASPSSNPMSEEDMVLAVEDLNQQVNVEGNWTAVREGGGGGFSGASIVVRAICEATGKTVDVVKAFLQKKLDESKAANPDKPLTRKQLYDSFRNPNSATGKIIKKLEEEKLAKESKVDADAALAELG